MAQPVAVPPPPAKEKKKKKQSKSLAGSREDLYHPLMNGKVSIKFMWLFDYTYDYY